MTKFSIQTSKSKEVFDITDTVNSILKHIRAEDGIVNLFVNHTTCALTTADLDPGTDVDLLESVMKIFPQGNYKHPHDPSHVGEHIMSSIIGPSLTIPVEDGVVVLGEWQRIILVELSGPQDRKILLNFISE